ncbi:MAG: hypothetical protein AAGG11_13780 [Pseudomonadota bacterium]
MHRLPRLTLAWLAAAVATLVLASLAATQGALAALSSLAVAAGEISPSLWLETAWRDLLGLIEVGSMPVAIAVALLLGLLITGLILRFIPVTQRPTWRMIGYPLAGAVALYAMHTLLSMAFGGIVPLAAVRESSGMLLQMAAGAVGGAVFERLSRVPTAA